MPHWRKEEFHRINWISQDLRDYFRIVQGPLKRIHALPFQNNPVNHSLSLLLFEPGKFLFAINGLAYGLMSLAALFSSGAFARLEGQAALRWAMVAHGLLAPFVVGALRWPSLVYIGALWIVTFPIMSVLLALHFHRRREANQ